MTDEKKEKPTNEEIKQAALELLNQTDKINCEENGDIYDDADLINYIAEPQDWLIESIIPKNEVGLITGKRGERKTFLAIYISICLAARQKLFGENDIPEKKRVLYVDEESGKKTIAARVKAIKRGLGIKDEILEVKFISFSGLKLDLQNSPKYKNFQKIVSEFQPHLIVVDCLQRCVTFELDKDNASISQLFTDTIRPIIQKYNCSWLLIHHLRKSPAMNYKVSDEMDEIRGGSELVNYSRFILMNQTPKDENDKIVFKILKMSNSEILPARVIGFENTEDGLKITCLGNPEDVLTTEVKCAANVKKYILQNGLVRFETKDIHAASDEIGFKRNLINDGLKFLIKTSFLKKERRGRYRLNLEEPQNTLYQL